MPLTADTGGEESTDQMKLRVKFQDTQDCCVCALSLPQHGGTPQYGLRGDWSPEIELTGGNDAGEAIALQSLFQAWPAFPRARQHLRGLSE